MGWPCRLLSGILFSPSPPASGGDLSLVTAAGVAPRLILLHREGYEDILGSQPGTLDPTLPQWAESNTMGRAQRIRLQV